MNRFRVLTLLIALVIVCGCTGNKTGGQDQHLSRTDSSDSGARAASSRRIADPCKLLTQTEASAAIGGKLGPGELKNLGVVTRCGYFNRAAEEELWLDVQNPSAPVTDSELFDSLGHGPDTKPVTGIGDHAIWAHSQYSSFLYILKGGNMVAMGLPRTMATMTPAVETAGKLVASRM